jgi:hypothetical protein
MSNEGIVWRCELCNRPIEPDLDEWHNGVRGPICGCCSERIAEDDYDWRENNE